MPSTRRNVQVTARRQEVAALYLQGKYQSEIATHLRISQAQVSYDLQAVQRAWVAASVQALNKHKATQLAKIDEVERTAWAAWERSLHPREITLTEETQGEKPSRKASVRREGQAGDPRFLERVQKCIDQRCQILGLFADTEALKDATQGIAAILEEARLLAAKPAPHPPTRPTAEA